MADASVRPAARADAADIARIQAAVWGATHSHLPEDVLEAVGSAEAAEQWATAAADPPSPRHRVLTALAGARAAKPTTRSPASDPDTVPALDGELLALYVDPAETGHGHGSRLVNAVADLARIDGVAHLHTWLSDGEADLRAFLVGAGWAADGARRSLDLRGDGDVVLDQTRLRTALVEL